MTCAVLGFLGRSILRPRLRLIYTYDPITGNLVSKAGVNYTYQPAHPHAVTAAGGTYTYDANGNMLARTVGGQSYTFTYDAEGRLTGVTGSVTATFVYDGDGKRVKSTINSVSMLFVGNYYEKTGSTITKYYYAAATRIAVRTGSTLTYLLGDHLGSTSIVTNSSGGLLMETRYKPFGEVRYATTGQTLPTRYTFTGQYSYMSDEATDSAGFGLMYFNARWVDPQLGRFAQADPLIPGAGDTQAWDRYAFVNNNPLRYIDPSGHAVCQGYEGSCAGGGGGGGGGSPGDNWYEETYVPSPISPWMNPAYSAWFSGEYSGCTLCHYAHAQGKAILTTNELAVADENFREWFAVGYGPIVATTVVVGAPAIAQEATPAAIITCLQSPICTALIGAGGTGSGSSRASASSGEICGNCGTIRPDLVRNPGALRVDPDGVSVFCRNCVANGKTILDPNGRYFIWSFDEFAEQAVKYGVSTPTYTAPPSGHFSTWAGAVNAIFDALNIWIRSGGKKTP